MMLYALLFAMQTASPPPPPLKEADPRPSEWSDQERQMRAAGAFDKSSDPAARLELEKWAGCVARKNPGEAARVLTMDFTTNAYGRALRMLSQDDRDCIGFRGSLRSAGLLFAGEMAETLLERDTAPLVSRLAKAGTVEATPAYSFTDKVAICVVRSVPNDIAALFATSRNSAEETASLNALAQPMAMCARAAQATKPIAVNPAGLRAMLATASFRSVAALPAAGAAEGGR
jgi:hypothetical protein